MNSVKSGLGRRDANLQLSLETIDSFKPVTSYRLKAIDGFGNEEIE